MCGAIIINVGEQRGGASWPSHWPQRRLQHARVGPLGHSLHTFGLNKLTHTEQAHNSLSLLQRRAEKILLFCTNAKYFYSVLLSLTNILFGINNNPSLKLHFITKLIKNVFIQTPFKQSLIKN